jgi:hypothetical protein
MTTLAFGEFRPDLSDLDGQHTRALLNCLPRGDGYGPIRDIAALTASLPAPCRGYFYARATDGSIVVFAGTSTKLYMLDNTYYTWTDVSDGGSTYTTLSSDANWSFAQFSNRIIACQANDDVQSFVLGSSSTFEDLAGSPPDAAYVTVVGSFAVLSGLTANPFRAHWSAIADPTGWTAGTNQSDYQDLPDGGIVRQVLGGEVGVICQDTVIRRMVYSPGSEVIFVIERIAKDIGLLHPYAATAVGDKIFLLTSKGFMQSDAAGSLLPIGAEKVDKTFLAQYDPGAPGLVQCAADPKTHMVFWTSRSLGMTDALFDFAFGYNWLLQRWVKVTVSGEYMASLAQPGLTIEGLDAIAPGSMAVTGAASNGGPNLIRITVANTDAAPFPIVTGEYRTLSAVGGVAAATGTWQVTRISGTTFDLVGSAFAGSYTSGGIVAGAADLMEVSWDAISVATLPNLSVADAEHKIAFFTGDNLEAVIETPEQNLEGHRMQVNGFWPITDATDVRGSISKRQSLQAAITYTNESRMNADGFVALIRSTRYSRGKVRIPSGTAWTYATGIKPLAQADGEI